jgi:8-oxo-dGTP pyrophosphatase MutT (NUDIX family)
VLDDARSHAGDPLTDLLRGYHPASPAESADVSRLTELLQLAKDPWARSTPLHVTASALIVHPASRQLLLRWHQRQQAWLQVGGHADPGESDPLAVALREAREETGLGDLRPWPTAALVQVAIVPVAAGRGEPPHEHADLRFVLATGEPDAIVAEHADAPLRWLPVESATDLIGVDNLREAVARVRRMLSAGPAGAP